MAVFVSPNKKSVAKFWEKRQKGTFSRTKVNEIDTCIRFISTFHVTRCFFLLVYFVTTKSNQKGTKTDPSKMSLRPSVRFCTLFWPFSHSFLPVFASFSARFLPPLPPIFCTLCRYFFAFLHLVEVDLPHLAVAAVVHVLAAVGPHLHVLAAVVLPHLALAAVVHVLAAVGPHLNVLAAVGHVLAYLENRNVWTQSLI